MKLNFWKHNKLDQHFQLTTDEVAEQFKAWIQKQKDWKDLCNYYRGGQLVERFISEVLESAWAHDDPRQEDAIYELAYQVLWADGGLMGRGVA